MKRISTITLLGISIACVFFSTMLYLYPTVLSDSSDWFLDDLELAGIAESEMVFKGTDIQMNFTYPEGTFNQFSYKSLLTSHIEAEQDFVHFMFEHVDWTAEDDQDGGQQNPHSYHELKQMFADPRMSYYFTGADLNAGVHRVPRNVMISKAITFSDSVRKSKLNISRFESLQIMTFKQMQNLPKRKRPQLIVENNDKIPAFTPTLLPPVRMHGALACEALAINGVNMSMCSAARAKECLSQQELRANEDINYEWRIRAELYYLRKQVDAQYQFHPKSLAVAKHAVVTSSGHIFYGNVWLQPTNDCEFKRVQNTKRLVPTFNENDLPHYGKVFVASKVFAHSLFHDYIEVTTRVLSHWRELKRETDVMIQVGQSGMAKKVLTMFGMPEDRIVSGDMTANIAMFPTPSHSCYFSGTEEMRTFRNMIWKYLRFDGNVPAQEETIIIIERTFSRQLTNHAELVSAVENAKLGGLKVVVFSDRQVPPLEDIWRMFLKAKVVIGPHGMGLSNIVAARPETVVIEFLPYDKPVMCFAQMAQALNQEYHAMVHSRRDSHNGTLTADVTNTINILKKYF